MADVTTQQGAKMGTDAVTLMFNLMQRNRDENEAIRTGLYDSVQRDLDEARATIGRIQRNVLAVLARPHTDRMVADALLAEYDHETGGAP